MKRNEIIELNGQEYTLELNRDSFLKIDQYCNFDKSNQIINKGVYEYIDEIKDDEDPFAEVVTDEELDKAIEEKEKVLEKLITRAFWIWLYPNHKLNIKQVEEILKPYFENSDKYNQLAEDYAKYLSKCVEIKESYEKERKNLKAQVDKK